MMRGATRRIQCEPTGSPLVAILIPVAVGCSLARNLDTTRARSTRSTLFWGGHTRPPLSGADTKALGPPIDIAGPGARASLD